MKQVDLLKFNSCAVVSEFKRNISSQSLLEIVGIERNEVRHSRFIKWLLSDSELNVDNSDSPLFHLLDAIIKRSLEQRIVINSDFADVVCSRYCSLHDVSVEVEHKTQGVKINGEEGLIDILIRGEIVTHHKAPSIVPFTIAIENKVDSSEHSSQTLKYEAYIKGRDVLNYYKGNDKIEFSDSYKCPLRTNEVPIFVYLTPSPESEMGHAIDTVSPNYIHINYQDLVDHILDPINGDTLVSSDKKYKIKQYLTTLSVPSVSLKNAKVNQDVLATAMAVSKDLKYLSLSIWNNHGCLIEDAIRNRNSGDLQNQFYETNQVLFRAVLNALLVFVELNSTVYPDVDYYKVKSLVCSMD